MKNIHGMTYDENVRYYKRERNEHIAMAAILITAGFLFATLIVSFL